MYVRQLIGRQAGEIVEMPFHAAQSNVAMGTAAWATDAELAKAGLPLPGGQAEAEREKPPVGYRIVPCEAGGFDVLDPAGERLNGEPVANAAAARSLADDEAAARAVPLAEVPGDVPVPEEWRALPWPQLRGLALSLDPAVRSKEAAIAAVEAELARRAA